jgi:hypothetical protein
MEQWYEQYLTGPTFVAGSTIAARVVGVYAPPRPCLEVLHLSGAHTTGVTVHVQVERRLVGAKRCPPGVRGLS